MNIDSKNTDSMNTDSLNKASNSNVDQDEIAKFEQLASRWWDDKGEFKPLHQINPLRANYIDERAAVAGKNILDVGCGGGILSEAMAQRGAIVSGIDMGKAPLEVARIHAGKSGVNIHYEQSTAEDYAQNHPETFDCVCCLEMLEHVPDPASTVKACADLTKSGGDLFFSTINRNPKSYAFAIIGAEYVLKLLPKGTHDYQKFIRPAELAECLREAGLELVDIVGMTYNPFTQQYRLNPRDVSVNYLLHAKKP